MEFLVTMTTHVPDGTSGQAVEDVRGREAARSRELAGQGHLLRLWVLPPSGAHPRPVASRDAAEMQAVLESLPLYGWMTAVTTPLTGHPSDPAIAGS